MSTNIQWTDETWNPTAGCSKVSDGCKNCYAIKDAVRLSGNDNPKIAEKYAGTAKAMNWTGKINLGSEETLTQPLRWTRPRRIFVNSMSDLFHENIPNEWVDKIFAVMTLAQKHVFQILTKRPQRMKEYFSTPKRELIDRWSNASYEFGLTFKKGDGDFDAVPCHVFNIAEENFPLKNVWFGVSVENQKVADERIHLLLETPAKVRFLSCEPLLSEIDLRRYLRGGCEHCNFSGYLETNSPAGIVQCRCCVRYLRDESFSNISWVIAGGESGNGARPCSIDWVRSIVNQCKSANISVFVKQLGEYSLMQISEWQAMSAEDKPLFRKENPQLQVPGIIRIATKDKKGGDISEFPKDLQIRELPK